MWIATDTVCLFYLEMPQNISFMTYMSLIRWGRVTHICVSKLTIIASDNGLSPCWRQAIIWTNAGILLIGPQGTNFNDILIEIHIISFKKFHLKMSSGKRRPSCLGLSVLKGLVAERNASGHTHTNKHVSNIAFFARLSNALISHNTFWKLGSTSHWKFEKYYEWPSAKKCYIVLCSISPLGEGDYTDCNFAGRTWNLVGILAWIR